MLNPDTTDKIERIRKFDDDKLIDIVKNYRQYGYDDDLRNAAILILEERGLTKTQLKLTGNFENRTYDHAQEVYSSFKQNSKIAFVLYALMPITSILVPILSIQSETIGLLTLIISWGSLIFYFIYLIKSFLNQSQFYKITGQDYGSEGALLYLFLGMPLYIFMYFYFRKQMNNQMKLIK